MPIDTCVQNVGEYYSSHYLDSTFARDMQQLQTGWREQGSRSVPRRLQALSERYFRAKSRALDEERPERRVLLGDEIAGWHGLLLDALGYIDREPADVPVDANTAYVPVLGRVFRYGKPWLLLTESPFTLPDSSLKDGMPSEDPLESEPLATQLRDSTHKLCPGDWSRAIGKIFTEEDAPRWILMLGGSRLLLLDRDTFAQARYLAFDLDDAYGKPERASFECMAAFLSADTLCPSAESVELFHAKVEAQSHKFAHGVSDKLQSAVREAIEILANEWVDYRKRKQLSYTSVARDGVLPEHQAQVTAERLRHEALVFVYRLLFCFYAEAHGTEVNILPVNADEYRLGYSLEALRELEQMPLTPETEGGTYFDTHIRILFTLVYSGFHPEAKAAPQESLAFEGSDADLERSFTLRPLTATIFDPSRTPLFNLAVFSNRAWQKVIRNLSLSKDERAKTIGRVNYAELGINQLGSVYEGLLSYKGMFADRDLIQVKPADDEITDKKTPTWFVPKERIEGFRAVEVERLANAQPRIYPRGSFILHLNGIDREQSASYYTPEALTQCLVREALRELLREIDVQDADRILHLRICEPAMGSGAFLYETARQLADRYLELKQLQTGQTIEPGDYADERRRVMHWITTRNIYGVDLNETAVELAGLSLWLGSIHRLTVRQPENGTPGLYCPGSTPWFGLRLRAGNSLIGARRATWTVAQLKEGLHSKSDGAVPRPLKPGEARRHDEIYHFLVFDPEMVPTSGDRLMKEHWPTECARAKKWIKEQVRARWSDVEVRDALEICDHIDRYWSDFTVRRIAALDGTACTTSVWPKPSSHPEARKPSPTLVEQETVRANLESASGAFQRVKLLMDCWCALWFWPLEETAKLPGREAWLASARLLVGETLPAASMWDILGARLGLDVSGMLSASRDELPDANALSLAVPWFSVAKSIAAEQLFHHWELVFPEIVGPINARGFDLILGNPPWRPVKWTDSSLLYEFDPRLGVKGALSGELNAERPSLLEAHDNRTSYEHRFRQDYGAQVFLGSLRLHPLLAGSQTNTYKNFALQTWNLLNEDGIGAMIHEDGIYDDPSNRAFRAEYYSRLRAHYQFRNELKLFKDIQHTREFGLNIFSGRHQEPAFHNIANLYHPLTIESSQAARPGSNEVPGLKTDSGDWEIRGHPKRVVQITVDELKLFSQISEGDGADAHSARLLKAHSLEIVEVLRAFARTSRRVRDLGHQAYVTEPMMFHESNAQRDGMITRSVDPLFQPCAPSQWILSGPHFFVGSPLDQVPRTGCKNGNDYDPVDLVMASDDFISRAIYKPGDPSGDTSRFERALPVWAENDGIRLNDLPKLVLRNMCDAETERTLIAAIAPAGCCAINTVLIVVFRNLRDLAGVAGATFSLPYDFLIKCGGRGHMYGSDFDSLPLIDGPLIERIANRALRLNCLTNHYADLWRSVATDVIARDGWACSNPALDNEHELPWAELQNPTWVRKTPVRTDFARRQALLEIDVLVALALGLTLEQLQAIYRVHFHVMRSYERTDEYDVIGRRLPNITRKEPGAKEVREARKTHDGRTPLTASWVIDNGLASITRTFYPPFFKVDREADYAEAYEHFQRSRGGDD